MRGEQPSPVLERLAALVAEGLRSAPTEMRPEDWDLIRREGSPQAEAGTSD